MILHSFTILSDFFLLDESINLISRLLLFLGAILLQHVDRLPSHILSAILQIDQNVDEDWPITFVDHEGKESNCVA